MSWTLTTTAFFDRRARKFPTKHPDLRPRFARNPGQARRRPVPTRPAPARPLGFRFYQPDPAVVAWKKTDAALQKQGVKVLFVRLAKTNPETQIFAG